MRETGKNASNKNVSNGPGVRMSSNALMRSMRLAAVVLGIGVVISAGAARAQDDEEDDSTIDQKIIKGIMRGIGGTNMENQGIDYRERSPLVVPPKINLPPPDQAARVSSPNWPKDPDVAQRKASAAAARTGRPEATLEAARQLTPAEMSPKRVRTQTAGAVDTPGDPNKNIILSPSQLGVESGMFKNMFGSNKGETAQFKGEPMRDDLTQPPSGYQTPSPNFAYGTGPKELMQNSANINPMTGKY